MLTRIILTGQLLGLAGQTTLSLAHILGVSDSNNRRDHICSAVLFHGGRMVQVIEGARADVDRLLRRMQKDTRFKAFTVLSDTPIRNRTLTEAAGYCHEPAETLARVGLKGLDLLSVRDVDAMLEYRQAA